MKTLLVAILLAMSASVAAEPWVNFLGSHYQSRVWADNIRDPRLIPGLQGYFMPDYPPAINALEEKTIIIGAEGAWNLKSYAQLEAYIDGIVAAGNRDDFIDQVGLFNIVNPDQEIFIQINNEINSSQAFDNIDQYLNTHSTPFNSFVEAYVEYSLAPTIEAIIAAQARHNAQVKIALGSISNFSNRSNHRLLTDILGYEIQGQYASRLAGQTVANLLDAVHIHYLGEDQGYALNLDAAAVLVRLHDGVMAVTEEIGAGAVDNGYGAARSIQTTARFIDWAYNAGHTSAQAQLYFWGMDLSSAPPGTDISVSLEQLHADIGEVTLTPIDVTGLVNGTGLTVLGFAAGDKTVIFMFPESSNEPATFIGLRLQNLGRPISINTYAAEPFSLGRNVTFPDVSAAVIVLQ